VKQEVKKYRDKVLSGNTIKLDADGKDAIDKEAQQSMNKQMQA
jgi:hypothetical protein